MAYRGICTSEGDSEHILQLQVWWRGSSCGEIYLLDHDYVDGQRPGIILHRPPPEILIRHSRTNLHQPLPRNIRILSQRVDDFKIIIAIVRGANLEGSEIRQGLHEVLVEHGHQHLTVGGEDAGP